MLGFLRRHKNSPIITIVLGTTAIVMIGFGISYQGGPRGLYAAEVNGDVISDAEYSARYANTYRYQQQQNRKYNKDNAKQDRLRENVLYGMVTTKLLSQKANARGLAVDDDMLRDRILEDERFKTEAGAFDRQLYERWMNSLQMSPERFEEAERERILSTLFISAVQNMRVSSAEMKDQFLREQTKVDIEFIKIAKSDFEKDVGTVTAADSAEWAKQEGADDKILAYYKKFKAQRYDVPKKVCARHVLAKAPAGTPPDIKKQAQTKIKAAAEALKAGTAFADVAAKFSDDANKNKGGDLGCFSAGQMLPKVEETAFGLKTGERSGIVETPFGYHIIEVTEIKDPVRRKLEDVRDEIIEALARVEKAGAFAKKQANEVQKLAQEKASLQEVADALLKEGTEPLKVQETGPFPEGREFLPRLGPAKGVGAAAWLLTKEKPVGDAPIETDDAWLVIRLKERKVPTDEEFEQAKLGLSYGLTVSKQTLVYDGWSENLRANEEINVHPVALSYDDQERQAVRGGGRR